MSRFVTLVKSIAMSTILTYAERPMLAFLSLVLVRFKSTIYFVCDLSLFSHFYSTLINKKKRRERKPQKRKKKREYVIKLLYYYNILNYTDCYELARL